MKYSIVEAEKKRKYGSKQSIEETEANRVMKQKKYRRGIEELKQIHEAQQTHGFTTRTSNQLEQFGKHKNHKDINSIRAINRSNKQTSPLQRSTVI